MHRFRKKQDLKKQFLVEYNNNLSTTNESQVSTSTASSTGLELPSLPPTDFRTSLILPTLTKRFSVLRRGEKANDTSTNVTKTSTTQESPPEIYNSQNIPRSPINNNNTNEVLKVQPGRSPLSNLMERPNDEELMSGNSSPTMSSITPPTSINTSVSTPSINNNHNHEEVLSNARKFYDPSRIQSVNNVSNNESVNENEENVSNKDDKNEIIGENINIKNLRRISSNGLLVNPTKDRPKPPRTRPPSILHVPQGYSWQNEFATQSKNNIASSLQLSLPNFIQSSTPQRGLSPRVTTSFNNEEEDSFLQPSSPRSPLDKLSEGLYNLKLQSSSSLSPSSPLYSIHNLSQTSLRSLGGSSVNEEEELESPIQPIQKSPSINSLRNIEDENIYKPDRASTTSTIGSSLKRIRTIKTTDSNISNNSNNSNHSNHSSNSSNSNNSSIDNEGDDEAEYESNRDSNETGIMYLKNTLSTKNNNDSRIQPESSTSDTTNITNITTDLQKKPSRGGTAPPPKPQPPPLSLTDTLIASGQSDIAHQVMVMRRVQNVNQQQLQPQYQFNTKQNPLRKWSKKNAGIKNISGPQLVSTSSNVKTIPIVQLGQTDDDKFRRKRESETGIGKSLRRIKGVFTSDSESALFGKKRMSFGSSNENLSRKFVSDENLNQRFVNNEKRGLDFVKRRAFSTRENNKPNDKLKQDIRNNLTFIMNNEQQQFNGDDIYISGDRSSTSVNSNGKRAGQQPLYDIYALKRHAEMITRYSNNKKIDNPIITSRPSSQSSSHSLTVDIPNESESVPSSPISPFSDYPSSTSTPPPISPRNPLRQPDKDRMKYSGSQNSISDAGSDDKRDSKDSRASSSRLMSIFNNYSNRSSKSSSRNSKSSDINHLQIPQTNNNIANDGPKSNKVIRRTIIITKPHLPPLPEDSTPSTPILLSSSANSSSSFISSKSTLKKKKVHLDDGKIHVASDGRQWFLSKESSNDDEKDEEIENTGDSTLLSIPIPKTSLSNRPPTPIPSPNTRENVMDLPYGIPIPPIPTPHRNSVASKTSKRTSKSSIASSLKSSSSKFNRKSIGGKSVYSTYGESIYDYYDYSDQEGADDESDSTRMQQLESQQHVEVLEMSDGSYVWQVVNGLREDMEDRSYYYADANIDDNGDDYSKIWPQDFGRLNYGRDLEDDQLSQLSFNDHNNVTEYSHLDDYIADVPNSSHLSAVESSSKQKHGQYLTPNVLPSSSPNMLISGEHNNSTALTTSNEEKTIPRTSVYFAKNVSLPKLLEEMTRGLGNVDLDREEEEIHYVYGGMTVEEKLDQVMRALGVDDRDVYIE